MPDDDKKQPQDGGETLENKPTEQTDEPDSFDREYVEKLRQENAKWRTQFRELEQWKSEREKEAQERAEAEALEQGKYKELLEKREQELNTLREQIAQKDKAILRGKIASELGIPAQLADRLMGDNEEAIRADAEQLLAALKVTEPEGDRQDRKPPTTTTAVPGGRHVGLTAAERIERRRNNNILGG